jgi:hypothetical protein
MEQTAHRKPLELPPREVYDLNVARPMPRIIEVDTSLLPRPWDTFCRVNRIRLFAILGYENPVENMKLWPAGNMIARGIEKGDHIGKTKIIDSSSGNEVRGLEHVRAKVRNAWSAFPIEATVAVIPRSTPEAKAQGLIDDGLEIEYADNSLAAMSLAAELAEKNGWWYMRQYWNEDNSGAYPPIAWHIAKTLPELGVIGAGVGSGGLTSGIMPELPLALESDPIYRRPGQQLLRVGVVVEDNEAVDGVRSEAALEPGSLDWRSPLEDVRFVGAERSLIMSAALWRQSVCSRYEPCFGGISTGFQAEGTLLALRRLSIMRRLAPLYDRSECIQAAFFAHDTRKPYRAKYEERGIFLPESEWRVPTFVG